MLLFKMGHACSSMQVAVLCWEVGTLYRLLGTLFREVFYIMCAGVCCQGHYYYVHIPNQLEFQVTKLFLCLPSTRPLNLIPSNTHTHAYMHTCTHVCMHAYKCTKNNN